MQQVQLLHTEGASYRSEERKGEPVTDCEGNFFPGNSRVCWKEGMEFEVKLYIRLTTETQ